jgi:uncharacterized protein
MAHCPAATNLTVIVVQGCPDCQIAVSPIATLELSRCAIMFAMSKKHYYFRLLPPRSTFPLDITDEERLLMQQHAVYAQRQFVEGKLLLYGPVMSPEGAFGLGVLEVADEAEARQFGENDPSVRAGLNRFEFHPMQVAAARAKAT